MKPAAHQFYPTTKDDGTSAWSMDNGDKVALALRHLSERDLFRIAKENGVQERCAKFRDKHSKARIRMYLAMMLRARARRGIAIKILGKELKI
jgi:hypothetical protein